jgi:hypothetical protein
VVIAAGMYCGRGNLVGEDGVRRGRCDDGVQRSALQCPWGGCRLDDLVARGGTRRERVAMDLGRVAIALVLLDGRANLADAAVEAVQRLLPGFPRDGLGASRNRTIGRASLAAGMSKK